MKYAPIKAFRLIDFRNFKDVLIAFDGCSTLTLVGGNEAGKSSVSKAFETIGANLSPKTQKDYIRSGTNGFMVAVLLDDEYGTVVYRKKGVGFNGYGIIQNGKEVWSIDKMDVSDVPPMVQDLLGFIIEPETKEVLNVRTYENLLLFIYTNIGSNYKIMYNALKMENMSRAIKIGTSEVNTIQSNINTKLASLNTVKEQLRNIRELDLGPVFSLRQRLEEEKNYVKILEQSVELHESIDSIGNELGALQSLEGLPQISEAEAQTLNSMLSIAMEISKSEKLLNVLTEAVNLELASENEAQTLNSLFNVAMEISESEKSISMLADVSNLELASENEAQTLNSILDLCIDLQNIEEKIGLYGEMSGFEIIQIDDIALFDTCVDLQKELSVNLVDTYKPIFEIENISEGECEIWEKVMGVVGEYEGMGLELSAYSDIPSGISESDLSILNTLGKCSELIGELTDLEQKLSTTDREIKELESSLERYGVPITTCRTCGDTVIFGEV